MVRIDKLVTYSVIPVIVLYVLVISTGSFLISLPNKGQKLIQVRLVSLFDSTAFCKFINFDIK